MKTETEKQTLKVMIEIYCRKNHGSPALCNNCNELLHYSMKRIEHCPFGIEKPACNKCIVHCYAPEKREKVKDVMRYSGKRMPFRHPYLSFIHLLKYN
jgi:hypothetical protein